MFTTSLVSNTFWRFWSEADLTLYKMKKEILKRKNKINHFAMCLLEVAQFILMSYKFQLLFIQAGTCM